MTTVVKRVDATYGTNNERFSLANKMHGQYFQLYYQRLMTMGPRVREAAREKWPNCPQRNVLELAEDEECVIVGTIYKDMKAKPIILDEYVKDYDREEEKRNQKETYTGEDDRLEFEDEGARVKLLNIDAGPFVTGVVCACKGKAVKGDFEVHDVVVYAAPKVQSAPVGAQKSGSKYVCLVSGFETSDAEEGKVGSVSVLNQMFVDYVTGAVAMGDDALASEISRIVRIVVAGGSFGTRNGATSADTLKGLDVMFTELASSVPVDVMSGRTDPSNQAMPQQPLHPVYFPEATRYEKTMRLVTNPHDFKVDETSFLGTSGQNVEDVMKFSTVKSEEAPSSFVGEDAAKRPVAALTQTLTWQHLAPGAPDTLACYPFKDRDPFVIESTPRVYFAGCQDAFGYARVKYASGEDTLVVSVPKFAKTGTAVLVDVESLECKPIIFSL